MNTRTLRIVGPVFVFLFLAFSLMSGRRGIPLQAQTSGSNASNQNFRTSSALCGNGVVEPGEECDDAWRNGQGSCSKSCKLFRCGDGILSPQIGEECEPPSATGSVLCGRYCGPKCKWFFGTSCAGSGATKVTTPSGSGAVAGSGSVADQSGDLLSSDGSGSDLLSDSGALAYSSSSPAAVHASSASAVAASSGKASQPPPSKLQSGSTLPPSSASGALTANPGQPQCGNGIVDPGEECDSGQYNSNTLANACRTDCRRPRCGDGTLDNGEECDNGPQNSDKNPNSCRTTCKLPLCGDGVVDGGELCDDGAKNGTAGDNCSRECLYVNPQKAAPKTSSGAVHNKKSGSGAAVPAKPKPSYQPAQDDSSGSPLFTIIIAAAGTGVPLLVGFLFRKKLMGLLRGKKAKSIDDVPLDEIEMPWHKW